MLANIRRQMMIERQMFMLCRWAWAWPWDKGGGNDLVGEELLVRTVSSDLLLKKKG
jgi:hypothetical protein